MSNFRHRAKIAGPQTQGQAVAARTAKKRYFKPWTRVYDDASQPAPKSDARGPASGSEEQRVAAVLRWLSRKQFASSLQNDASLCDWRLAAVRPRFASSRAPPRTCFGDGSPLGGPVFSTLRWLSQTLSYLLDFLRRALRSRIGPRFTALRRASPFS